MRYLVTYGLVSILAKKKRNHQFFVEGRSNIDRHILSDGYFEKGILEALRDVIDLTGHRALLLDVGANIGNHTVALAEKFNRVDSVEPHPVLFHILTANVMKNRLNNVTLHNFGLACEDTEAILANPSASHGAAMVKDRSMLSQGRAGLASTNFGDEYPIMLKSAETFFASFGPALNRAFVKIDVEGMEQEIVAAMIPTLREYKPIVGFEWFTEAQPELGRLVAELDGYELWGIHSLDEVGPKRVVRGLRLLFKGRQIRLAPIDLDNLARVYTLALLVPTGKLCME